MPNHLPQAALPRPWSHFYARNTPRLVKRCHMPPLDMGRPQSWRHVAERLAAENAALLQRVRELEAGRLINA